jgi:phosphatidylinositol 3-kinase
VAECLGELYSGCGRPLDSRDRALLWRFRWALTGEKRALTRVLACVDWGDAAEAKEAAALTAAWAPVDIATALELLSPAFSNPEVHGLSWLVMNAGYPDAAECCTAVLYLDHAHHNAST